MGCVFHAVGESFPVRSFLARSSIVADRVLERGKVSDGRLRPEETNGFSVWVSEDENVYQQISAALAFVTKEAEDLRALSHTTYVEDMQLDFMIEVDCSLTGPPGKRFEFDQRLVRSAADLNILLVLTIVPTTADR